MAICIGCACTDNQACPDGCWWLRLHKDETKGVCSNCEDHRERFDNGDFAIAVATVQCPKCKTPQDGSDGFSMCSECGHCAHVRHINHRCLACDEVLPRKRVPA